MLLENFGLDLAELDGVALGLEGDLAPLEKQYPVLDELLRLP
jgi:hypothetical protein